MNGKGKGRATGAENVDNQSTPRSPERSSQNSNSMLERVTASAAGLAHSAFTVPSSNELTDRASAVSARSGKESQVGGSSSTAFAESSRASHQPTLSTLQGQSPASIRAGHRGEHIQNAEAEFSSFLDGIPSFTASLESHNGADLAPGLWVDKSREGGGITTDTFQNGIIHREHTSVDEQQRHDGDEVLAILSDPYATVDDFDTLALEDETVDWNLTDEQISRIRAIMNELFPMVQPHREPQADHALNLVPDMLSTTSSFASVTIRDTKSEDSDLYYGQNIPQDTARQMWMDQWEAVLTRYTDEVWGDLLPLVVEAREEVQALKDKPGGPTTEQPKALRRLQLVLDHLRIP
jgi:hypothetical protein